MKLYEPAGLAAPAVVVEDESGRWLVRQASVTDPAQNWAKRTLYRGHVRPDPIASTLRGLAWALGVPGAMAAEVPGA